MIRRHPELFRALNNQFPAWFPSYSSSPWHSFAQMKYGTPSSIMENIGDDDFGREFESTTGIFGAELMRIGGVTAGSPCRPSGRDGAARAAIRRCSQAKPWPSCGR